MPKKNKKKSTALFDRRNPATKPSKLSELQTASRLPKCTLKLLTNDMLPAASDDVHRRSRTLVAIEPTNQLDFAYSLTLYLPPTHTTTTAATTTYLPHV
jgi:hypothetical protein